MRDFSHGSKGISGNLYLCSNQLTNVYYTIHLQMHRGILQLVFVVTVVVATFSEVSGAPPIREIRAKDGSEPGMTNALKYLEELDKYYSQVARPRYLF